MSGGAAVSLDTCVLLRLFNVGREDLLAALKPIDWVVVPIWTCPQRRCSPSCEG